MADAGAAGTGRNIAPGSPALCCDVSARTHLFLMVNADGGVSVWRGSTEKEWSDSGSGGMLGWSTQLATSAPGLITQGVGFHVQFKATIHDSAGSVYVRVNDVLVCSGTGLDTRNEGAATVSQVLMGFVRSPVTTAAWWDDYWAADDFIGDRRVDSHFPTADGTNQDGTPSTGSRYACVDESPSPNDDTDYVTLAAAGNRETYQFEDYKNPGGTIDAVLTVLDARKLVTGAGTIAPVIRRAGTNYDGIEAGLTINYQRVKNVYQTDPATLAAWTEANFNAGEFGAKKVA